MVQPAIKQKYGALYCEFQAKRPAKNLKVAHTTNQSTLAGGAVQTAPANATMGPGKLGG
jgi:hypothetical protein